MSRTYSIGCEDCKEELWIGQGWPGRRCFIYTSNKKTMQALGDFLFKHENHRLRFYDNEGSDFKDIEFD